MPLFEVSAPNGSKYRVTVPDGAGEKDAIEYVADNMDKLPKYEPSITDKATDVAKEVGRGLGNVASDIGAGIRRAGQRLGVISDPDEDKYVAQNAKGPQDVERVRDEFRQRKYSSGGVMQDANNGGPGHFPVSEMNRPANTKPAEQIEAEAAGDRRAAAREQALRDQPGISRPLSKVNPLERDYGALQRIEAENKSAPLLAQTMEGRVARGINQGLDVPSAQGRAIMDATNGVENPVQQTGTDEELAASFESSKEYGKAGFIRRAGAKALEGTKRGLYGALEAYSDFLGTDDASAVLAKASARSNLRERAMGSRDGVLGALEDAASSVAQNAPALLSGIMTGRAAVPLAMMYVQTFGTSYGDAKARGYSPTDAGIYASVNGAAEVIGESFGMKSFGKLLGKSLLGKPVAQIAVQAADHIIHEIPGEQLTTLIQFLAEKGFTAGKTPNANLADYLAQAGETLTQTILQSGMMYGGMLGIDKASKATGGLIAGDPGTGRRSLLERLAATGSPGEVGPVTGRPGGAAPPPGGGDQPLAASDVLGAAQAETAGTDASGTAGAGATPPGSPVPDTAPIMKTIAKAREAADAEELRQQKAALDELQPDVDAIFKTTLKEGLAAGKAEETAQKEATVAAKLAEAEHKAAANDLEVRIAQMEGDPNAIMAAATARPAIMATLDAAKAEAAALEKPAKKAGKAAAPAETIAEEPNAQPAPASQAPDALTVHDELADAVKAKLISKDDYAAASAELLGGNPAPAAQLLSGLTSNPDYVSRKISQAWKAGKITDQQQAEASAALAGGRVADALSIVRAGKPADVSKTNQEEAPADSGPVNRAESPAFGSLRTTAPTRRSAGINALTSVISRGIDAPMDVIQALRQNGHMASARVATALAHLTGRKVVWYNNPDSKAAGYTGEGGDRDTLHLNASSRFNILKVFGHELLHSLATSNPMLYASLVNRLKSLMWNVPEYKAFVLRTDPRTRGWDQAKFEAHVTEEMIADFMGEFMVETGFWKNAFRGQDRGWVDRIRNAIIRAITDFQLKLASVSQKGFNTGHFLSPATEAIQQARDALEEAFTLFVNEAAAKNQSIDDLAHEAATSTKNELAPPTEAQIANGNYKKGHINVSGLDITIENPAGSKRRPEWPTLKYHYGYFKGTVGKDGDHVDVFVKPGIPSNYNGPVFIVDQNNDDGGFDEHKALIGPKREREARNAYLSNYTRGWESHIGGIRSFDSVDSFREWLKTADLKQRAADTTVMSPEEDRPGKMSEEEMRAVQEELDDLNSHIEHINYDNSPVSEDEDFKSDGLNWTFHALGHRWVSGTFTIRLTNDGAYRLTEKVGGDDLDLGDFPSLLSAAESAAMVGGENKSEQPDYAADSMQVIESYRDRVLASTKIKPTKDENYANELKPILNGGVKKRYRDYVREQIAEAWAELAATKGVKRYGKMSKAKTFEGIAKDFGMNPTNTDRPRIVDIYKRIFVKGEHGNEWQSSEFDGEMSRPEVAGRPFRDKESIRITLQMPGANGKKVYGDIIFQGNKDTLGRPVAYLNTTQIGEGNLGRQFYQVVFNWAVNNGVKIIQDPMMLTSINSFRRTELMLSAALRMGTTKMMGFPSEDKNDQRLVGWIENPVMPLRSGKRGNTHAQNYARDMENLANLILTSYDNVNHFIGDRLKAYSYEPKTDSIVRTNANGVKKTVSNEMLARAEAGRGDARLVGAGETTIRKFLITRWMLDELNRGADSSDLLDQMEAQGQGASQGVVYKMDDDFHAPLIAKGVKWPWAKGVGFGQVLGGHKYTIQPSADQPSVGGMKFALYKGLDKLAEKIGSYMLAIQAYMDAYGDSGTHTKILFEEEHNLNSSGPNADDMQKYQWVKGASSGYSEKWSAKIGPHDVTIIYHKPEGLYDWEIPATGEAAPDALPSFDAAVKEVEALNGSVDPEIEALNGEGKSHPDSFWETNPQGKWVYTHNGTESGLKLTDIGGGQYALYDGAKHVGDYESLDAAQVAGEGYADQKFSEKAEQGEFFWGMPYKGHDLKVVKLSNGMYEFIKDGKVDGSYFDSADAMTHANTEIMKLDDEASDEAAKSLYDSDDNNVVIDLKKNFEIDLAKIGGTKQFYGGEKFSEDVVNGVKWEKFKKTIGSKKLTYWLEPGSGLVIVKSGGEVIVMTPSGDQVSSDGFIKAAKQLDETYLIPGSTSKVTHKKQFPPVLAGGFALGGWTYQHMKQKQQGGMPNKQFLFHKPSGMKIEPQQIGDATYYSASIGNKLYATDEVSASMAASVAKSVYASTHTDSGLGSTGPVVNQDSVEQFLSQNPEYLDVVASTDTAPSKKKKPTTYHDYDSLVPLVQEAVQFLANHKGISITDVLKAWGLQNPKGLYGEADILGYKPSPGAIALGDDASAEMKAVKKWLTTVTSTNEFKAWFGNSIARYKSGYLKGLPIVYFRGDSQNIKVFNSGGWGLSKAGDVVIFASPAPATAAIFGGKAHGNFDIKALPTFASEHIEIPKKNNLYPVFVRAENPFDFERADHVKMLEDKMNAYNKANNLSYDISDIISMIKLGSWSHIEKPGVQKAVRSMGFDSFYTKEGAKNVAVYSRNQMKSATHNSGAWSRQSDDITMSVESDRPEGYPAKKSEADKSIKYVAAKTGSTKEKVFKKWGYTSDDDWIALAESMGRWTAASMPKVPKSAPKDMMPKAQKVAGVTPQSEPKVEYVGQTINVDGKDRPTTNNYGRQIYPTKEGLINFWKWFGDSIATDAQGRPVVFYHGTATDPEEKGMENSFSKFNDWVGELDDVGNKFTSRPSEASGYAGNVGEWGGDGSRPLVVPVYIRIIRLDNGSIKQKDITTKTDGGITYLPKGKGGGAITSGGQIKDLPDTPQGASYWATVFDPKNIKSAVGNSGAFSKKDARMVFATAANRPGGGRSLRERLYGTVSAAAAAPAPVTKAMQFTNKAANTILYPFKIIGDRTLAPVSDRLVQWGSNFMAAGARRQRIAHGLSSDYGLPEPYIDARNDREIEINKTLRKSKALIDRIASLDRAEARVAYLWMQEKPNSIEEQALMALLDPDSVAVLTDMKQEIDRLGQEAVRLGLLSPESYARNKMAYLHRTYQKHELDNPDAVARATQAKAIRADAYKLRGLRDNVVAAGYPNAQKGDKFVRLEKRNAAGVLQNVAYVKQGQPAPAKYAGWTTDGVWEYRFDDRMQRHGEMGMWRDLTAQERGRLGEIDEVRYAFARTMIATVRDIETARFLDWVGSTYGKSGTDVLAMGGVIKDASDAKITMETYALNEWVQVPMTEIKGTGIKKYGGAAGYHIPGHIWNDIRTVMNLESNSEVWKLYDSLLKMWKISKTALSPAVHTNNVMSNFILADLAGLGVDDVRRALRVIFDAKAGNANAKALMERFYDSGSELGSMAQIELRQEVIEPLLKELQGQQNSTLAQLSLFQGISLAAHGKFSEAKAVLGSKAPVRALGVPFRAMIDLYRNEDAVFRLAKFIMETNAGKADKDAGKLARAAFLDYNINAPWIQMIRRGPLPFVAFSYRAIPIIASAVVHQPHKVLKYAAVGHLLNAIAYAMLGAGADEDQERRMMAKEKSGRALGVFPRMIRMPWNDEHNSPVFLDVRRWIPGGDIMDLMGSHSALPIPQWLSIGGPVSYFAEFFLNKSSFTGKPITLETDTASEKAVKVFDHLFKFLAPNLPVPNPVGWWADSAFDQIGLFQTYSWKSIQSAGSGETDAFGRERNLRQAILGSVGVKETSQPADAAEQRLKYEHDKQARELNEQKASLKRMLDRKGVSPEKFEAMMKNIERKQERISGEFQKAVSPEPASAQ